MKTRYEGQRFEQALAWLQSLPVAPEALCTTWLKHTTKLSHLHLLPSFPCLQVVAADGRIYERAAIEQWLYR